MFVVFEGMDGSGKTKLIESIANKLVDQNIKVHLTREPGGSDFAEELRKIIVEIQKNPKNYNLLAETTLILLARDDHINKLILPKLKKGYIVICDRFSLSTTAYQQIMFGISEKKINSLKKLILTTNLKPNLTFFLNISPQLAISRIKKRNTDSNLDGSDLKSLSYYKSLLKSYNQAISVYQGRIIELDASLRLEKNCQEVYKLLLEEFNKPNVNYYWS